LQELQGGISAIFQLEGIGYNNFARPQERAILLLPGCVRGMGWRLVSMLVNKEYQVRYRRWQLAMACTRTL
jgi:hypothetical protein